MERYKNCKIYIDRDRVKALSYYHYGSIKKLCEHLKISMSRYGEIVRTPHRSKAEPCIVKIAAALGVSVNTITYEGEL